MFVLKGLSWSQYQAGQSHKQTKVLGSRSCETAAKGDGEKYRLKLSVEMAETKGHVMLGEDGHTLPHTQVLLSSAQPRPPTRS